MVIENKVRSQKLKIQYDFFKKKLIKVLTLVFNLVLFFKLGMLVQNQGAHTKIKKPVRFF